MQRLNTKQMMDNSKCFTFLFWGTIFMATVAFILNIIESFISYSDSSEYNCRDYYYYNTYECVRYGMYYCQSTSD